MKKLLESGSSTHTKGFSLLGVSIVVVFLVLVVIVIFVNGKSADNTVKNLTVVQEPDVSTLDEVMHVPASEATNDTYRFIASFYSVAAGPEADQIQKFETFLADYSQKIGRHIEVKEVNWGREGEVDYCLQLSEIASFDQEKFIAEAKSALRNATRVNFSENAPCKNVSPFMNPE